MPPPSTTARVLVDPVVLFLIYYSDLHVASLSMLNTDVQVVLCRQPRRAVDDPERLGFEREGSRDRGRLPHRPRHILPRRQDTHVRELLIILPICGGLASCPNIAQVDHHQCSDIGRP